MKWLKKEASVDNLNTMIDFIIEHLKCDVEVNEHVDMEMRLVCEEVLMNIISHAYPHNNGDMSAGYEYDYNLECVVLKMCDHGIEFNPIEMDMPDLTGGIMDREIGGLGILMIKKISDNLEYERKDGMNILTIKKYYHPMNDNT